MGQRFICQNLAIIISFYLLSIIPNSTPKPNYMYSICSNTTTFAPNTSYHTNLQTIFTSLTSNATNPKNFYTTSAGNTSTDTVYGQFLCRGDLNSTACRDCVSTATTTDLPKTYCPNRKQAIIWYDECMVRYLNKSLSGKVMELPSVKFHNTKNTTGSQDGFLGSVEKVINKVVDGASNVGFGQMKFATLKISIGSTQNLYGLGQCTPDLSSVDCKNCLITAAANLPLSNGGRVLMPSCNVRYEIYLFFSKLTMAPVPAPMPSLLSPSRTHQIHKNQPSWLIIAISVVSSIVLVIAAFCIYNRKKKATNDCSNISMNEIKTLESLKMELSTIRAATSNFSLNNKLGSGGFGEVYKGILEDGQEVAVKRLSKNSGQGIQEFKTELILVANLQHKNLVKLLGFCLTSNETILVYEFLQKASLDKFLTLRMTCVKNKV